MHRLPERVVAGIFLVIASVFAACSSSGGHTPDAYVTPTLTLAPGQPASCPTTFPANGTSCTTAATCEYNYPPGTHPSGCGATCETDDAGTLAWNVPLCF
jgi:hypothetical protein